MKLLMKYLSGLVEYIEIQYITHQHYVYVMGAAQEPNLSQLAKLPIILPHSHGLDWRACL